MFPLLYNNSEMYQILFQDMINLKWQSQYAAQSEFYQKRREILSVFEDDMNSVKYLHCSG